jgi:hypothetical protein
MTQWILVAIMAGGTVQGEPIAVFWDGSYCQMVADQLSEHPDNLQAADTFVCVKHNKA